MSQFVLVDHSLRDLGGHYYTYASCVLPAAERAGFRVVLAVNRVFRDFAVLPSSWEVHAVFNRKSYSQRELDVGIPGGAFGWWQRLRKSLSASARIRAAESFAADCATLFERLHLQAGDHVFLATASEVDLAGLALFLKERSAYRDIDWHLQFHVGFLDGRPTDYARQAARLESMRAAFGEALALVPGFRIHLYCTTEALTEQYQRLGVASFQTLSYPVHPLFHVRTTPGAMSGPLRIACLGHSRREKGYRELPTVVRRLWPDSLSTGRAQLVLQTRRRDIRRPLEKLIAALGPHRGTPPLAYAAFPLALDQYAALVRESDVGLLLYEGARYYARCSGVLLEMLVSGVPVVVPAACWLSEQIDEPNQQYLESVAATATLGSSARQAATFGRTPLTCELPLPPGATTLLTRFLWPSGAHGTYINVNLEELDPHGARVSGFESIVGRRADGGRSHVLFHLHAGASTARVTWRNAWGDEVISLQEVDFRVFDGPHRPAGAIGLTAVNLEQSAELLADILQHADHYRQAAARHAATYAEHHSGNQVVATLTAAAAIQRPVNR